MSYVILIFAIFTCEFKKPLLQGKNETCSNPSQIRSIEIGGSLFGDVKESVSDLGAI